MPLRVVRSGVASNQCRWDIVHGDALQELRRLPRERFDCIVTSPPYYWQRDYGVAGQIGNEATIDEYVSGLVQIMAEAKQVLSPTGLLFLNLGDTYYSGKGQPKGGDRKSKKRRFGLRAVDASGLGVSPKTAIGIPWRVALAMIDEGWVLRAPIVWQRADCLVEPSAKDRPWRTYEFIFMFAKSRRYYFNREELGEEEDVWRISARPRQNGGLGTAPFPDDLVRKCLVTGCRQGGKVLDPFVGSGTTARVAVEMGLHATGIDLNEDFCDFAARDLARL